MMFLRKVFLRNRFQVQFLASGLGFGRKILFLRKMSLRNRFQVQIPGLERKTLFLRKKFQVQIPGLGKGDFLPKEGVPKEYVPKE
ncbi:hypothetical protein PCOAH_00009100 [Plasmodium coatneyi]|uniref:Uncharacterized protein n=1 Tax=Plasmodium coatneyi TaxID=208452 RepID=A0A1B1DUM8_9APIC|nr:hypothetical protein PCOAH_00009100 [Plasmodium coatneyi]ANQ06496.1 hypothetical protein PCOAH_00009100 [Plasmodium coatneyi]